MTYSPRFNSGLFPVTRAFLLACLLLLLPIDALQAADAAVKLFDVPAGAASRTLKLFAQQSGREIVFSAESIGATTTNAVRGELAARDALDQMTAGTGLAVGVDEKSGLFSVRKEPTVPNVSRATAGTVTGLVRNAAIDGPLSQASVVAEPGSKRILTDEQGRYALSLPPGRYTLTVTYTGLDAKSSSVQVDSGSAINLNFDLTSDVYLLDEFVVRTIREDAALSLQQQRYSMNVKRVIATDAFGAPADNPGELLQRMAGISTNFEQGEAASVSIRGMGQEFAKMTVDGEPVATSFGNFLNDRGRSFILTERSTNNLAQIELIKAPTPDQDADAIAGTVNLVSRRHFDRASGVQINATMSGVWRDVDETARTTRSRLGRYGRGSISYNDSFGVLGGSRNFGVAVDAAWSRVLRAAEDTGPEQAGTLAAGYVNGSGNEPLTRNFATVEVGGPIEKFNASASFDYRLKAGGFLFLKTSYTHQDRDIGGYRVTTVNSATSSAAFAPGSTYDNSTVLPAATSRLRSSSHNSLRQSEQYNASAGGEIRLLDGDGTLSFLGSFSHAFSKNPHSLSANAEVSGIGFQIDRLGASPFNPQFRQTAGPSWSDPSNYRITNITTTKTKGAPTDNYAFRLDYSHELRVKVPVQLKTGLKFSELSRYDRRPREQWTYVGPDGIPNSGDETMGLLMDDSFRIGKLGYGPFPFLPKVTGPEGIAPSSYWRKTAAQAYAELTGPHARRTDMSERMTTGYAMSTVEWGKWRSVLGVRMERTDLDSTSWLRNATAAWGGNNVGGASTDPAVVAANIARAERSFVRQQQVKSSQTEVFPGLHLVWEPREALLMRASYNRSIARPNINQILPTGSVNDETMVITIGNPDLKPYLADNFEISVERYLKQVGLISVGAFHKKITRYFRSFSDVVGSEGVDGVGTYAGYQRTTARNIGSAEIQGMELEFQQQFRRLPGWLSGLGAFANFTYLRAEGDFGSTDISNRLPNMSPRTLNAGLSYVSQRWQIRPLLNWQDRTFRGTSGGVDFDSASRTRIDLKMQYTLSKRYNLELSTYNITNQPDYHYISSDRGLPFGVSKPGVAYSLGVTGRF